MHRKQFLKITGISIGGILLVEQLLAGQKIDQLAEPDMVEILSAGNWSKLNKSSDHWSSSLAELQLQKTIAGFKVYVETHNIPLEEIRLTWNLAVKKSQSLLLNDQWERTYGDISWHKSNDDEMFPWYFMEHSGDKTNAFGVKTGAATFCSWKASEDKLQLILDTRSGGDGVRLGKRKLQAAEIMVRKGKTGESAFAAQKNFAAMMCPTPKLPKQPVYGINDWYYSYGKNSDESIIIHTKLLSGLAPKSSNRPFSIIDAGWYKYSPKFPGDGGWGDRMDVANEKFKNMYALTKKINGEGMRPGIWTRPLCGSVTDDKNIMLPSIKGRKIDMPVLDPSLPDNLERIKKYFKLYRDWGFDLVKFDFTSYDIFGKWGFQMLKDGRMTEPGWRMADNTKTNAEIILELYKAIRTASPDMYIISCNTISHLCAGIFEINRIGDDTSGREWDRTRKMGVNTLAFRAATQNQFYSCDADCVGLTTKIKWELNKQWMELLAGSGTPLLISAEPEAVGAAQKEMIKRSFDLASRVLPVGEPLDWMATAFPRKWKLNGKQVEFNWDE